MKFILPALLFSLPPALYGQVAVTEPVGYIIHPVAGNDLGNPLGADTFLSLALVERREFTGVVHSVSGGTLHFAGPVGTEIVAGDVWLEVANGPMEGAWGTVTGVSSDGMSITLDSAIPGLFAGTVVTIRRFSTLGRFLNFTIFDPADEVYVPSPSGAPTGPYFYSAAGWVDSGGNPAGGVVLKPGSAVLYRRKGPGSLNFISVGHVKIGKSQIPFNAGDNWLSPMHAVSLRLENANLDAGHPATGVGRGDGSGAEDYVVQFNLDQTASSFFAADPATGVTGFVDMNGTPSGHVLLSESQGFLLRRQPSLGAGIWTVPAIVIAPSPGAGPAAVFPGSPKSRLPTVPDADAVGLGCIVGHKPEAAFVVARLAAEADFDAVAEFLPIAGVGHGFLRELEEFAIAPLEAVGLAVRALAVDSDGIDARAVKLFAFLVRGFPVVSAANLQIIELLA